MCWFFFLSHKIVFLGAKWGRVGGVRPWSVVLSCQVKPDRRLEKRGHLQSMEHLAWLLPTPPGSSLPLIMVQPHVSPSASPVRLCSILPQDICTSYYSYPKDLPLPFARLTPFWMQYQGSLCRKVFVEPEPKIYLFLNTSHFSFLSFALHQSQIMRYLTDISYYFICVSLPPKKASSMRTGTWSFFSSIYPNVLHLGGAQ